MIRGQADCPLRIHHPLPRNRLARGQRMKCIAHEARLPGELGKARDLTIGSYAAARYARNDVVDAVMQTFGRRRSHRAAYYAVSIVP